MAGGSASATVAAMSRFAVAVVAALLCMQLACADVDDAGSPARWKGSEATEGNVTTVRTDSGSVWSRAELVETTSIGTLEGDDPYVFSQIRSVAATDDRIYVLDTLRMTVRVFDADGAHVMDIGREGDGPGEFRRPWTLGIVDGERLFVRDRAQGRVHELSLSGELLGDFRATGAARTTFTDDGDVYVHGWMPVPEGEERRLGMLAHGRDGPGEPVPIPSPPLEPEYVPVDRRLMELAVATAAQQGITINVNEIPFLPYPLWTLANDASMISGYPDTYAFEREYRDGTVMRIEKNWQPVPVDADEARWYRDRLMAFWRELIPEFVWQAADVPGHKRAYLALFPDHDGRVWVVREVAGERLAGCDEDPADLGAYFERPCWRQPYVMEAFSPDGRYLGSVELPDGLRLDVPPEIRDDIVVAVFEDEAGAIMVKRFRLEVRD